MLTMLAMNVQRVLKSAPQELVHRMHEYSIGIMDSWRSPLRTYGNIGTENHQSEVLFITNDRQSRYENAEVRKLRHNLILKDRLGAAGGLSITDVAPLWHLTKLPALNTPELALTLEMLTSLFEIALTTDGLTEAEARVISRDLKLAGVDAIVVAAFELRNGVTHSSRRVGAEVSRADGHGSLFRNDADADADVKLTMPANVWEYLKVKYPRLQEVCVESK